MLIPVRLPSQVPPSEHSLPPALATLGSNETVIIELQGSIEVEGDHTNQVLATLDMSNEVSVHCLCTISFDSIFPGKADTSRWSPSVGRKDSDDTQTTGHSKICSQFRCRRDKSRLFRHGSHHPQEDCLLQTSNSDSKPCTYRGGTRANQAKACSLSSHSTVSNALWTFQLP
jgi:hypothetical protein